MIDISKITNPEAKRFITVFFMYRGINRTFYELVPEEKFDFRMVDDPNKKSDSVRENLIHQINVERAYLLGVGDGKLEFGKGKDETLKTKNKQELINCLDEVDRELIKFLAVEENVTKKVQVRWSPNPIPAIAALWVMNDHEILHNGINIAFMDYLGMERFEELKRMWG